jgi:hypothetical protein
VGEQPTLPAAGTNRRVTVFGSVEALGRGRVEVVCAGQDSACFLEYLKVLGERHRRTGREVFLVLDNGPCHTSKASEAALSEREEWLRVIPLALQPAPEPQRAGVALPQARRPLAPGGDAARVRGRHPGGAGTFGRRVSRHRGQGARVVHRGAPQGTDGQSTGSAQRSERLPSP